MVTEMYDQNNNKVGTIDLPDKIFKSKWNPDLVRQVLIVQVANTRQSIAHTKDRSEVRGGGRKPWRQKHTGRARHGSNRSPLWVGGGITFGPRNEEKFEKKINKKMKQRALFSVLSEKLSSGQIRILKELNLKDHKTKYFLAIFKKFFSKKSSILVVPTSNGKNIFLAARNAPDFKILEPRSLNVYDCLKHNYIFFDQGAISKISEHYKK